MKIKEVSTIPREADELIALAEDITKAIRNNRPTFLAESKTDHHRAARRIRRRMTRFVTRLREASDENEFVNVVDHVSIVDV